MEGRTRLRILGAGLIGNVMEWYDFAVYGFFASTIGTLFFPSGNPTTSLIASFGAFAAGFLMRPVGAILFGHIGDILGRKKVLTISVMLMAIPTFLVGLLPTYDDIGLAAPVLIVLLRMMQGVSVGGEYTGSFVFLVERAPKNRRGLYSSWSLTGALGGILLGSGIGALVTNLATPDQLNAWGWRIPFLAGILVAGTGWLIRRGITEEIGEKKPEVSPLAEAVRGSRRELLQSFGLNVANAVNFYIIFIYISTWLVAQDGTSRAEALDINTVSMAITLLIIPLVAFASDHVGRKPFLLVGSGGLALLGYPLILLMHHTDPVMETIGQIGLAVFLGIFLATIPVTVAELFPRRIRVSATSLSYNLPLAIFGGTAPMVATWLITETGNAMAVAWYLSAAALVGFLVTLTLKETHRKELE